MEKKQIATARDGGQIYEYTIKDGSGASCCVMNYGAALLKLIVPVNKDEYRDVVLGLDDPEDYYEDAPCFGLVIGPHANRVENAAFEMNGRRYQLEKNNGENYNHGGPSGWERRVWKTDDCTDSSVTFSLETGDMDCGFPGGLSVKVKYELKDNVLVIDYYAKAKSDAVFSPTNHSYFNLDGHDTGTIEKESLVIFAEEFLPGGEDSVTRGEIRSVENTPFDFRKKKTIGRDINSDHEEIIFGRGYDHCFILNKTRDEDCMRFDIDDIQVCHAARMTDSKDELTMDVYTTQPGMMVYTGNWINGEIAKGGRAYEPRAGVAFETQFFPNALNIKKYEQPIIHAGEEKHFRTVFAFSHRQAL